MQEPAHLLASYLRFLALLIAASVALGLLEGRYRVLTNFFSETSSALNLAIFRMIVALGLWTEIDLHRLLTFASLDSALLFAPKGWSSWASLIPRSPVLVESAYWMFIACGLCMFVGLLGRWATLGTAVSAFYLLTLPQLWGKVNHYHHLIFFCFLLAFLPCSNTLSLDAIYKSIRSADREILLRNERTRTYAFGLKVAVVTIGLIYFFPGAWKLCRSWPYWFTSHNMGQIIAMELLEGRPTHFQLQISQIPILLAVAPYCAVAFELAMMFLFLSRRTRPFAVISGLLFHNSTGAVMGIWFTFLQICYVALIDWTGFFGWLADKFHLTSLTIVCDSSHRWSRRAAGILSNLDWLDKLQFVAGKSPDTVWPHIACLGERSALQEVSSRIVIFWPLYGLLRISAPRSKRRDGTRAISALGICTAEAESSSSLSVVPSPSLISVPATVLAYSYLAGMVCLGVAHGVSCWPIACYPTFDSPTLTSIQKLSIQAVDVSAKRIDAELSYDLDMAALLGSERWDGLVQQFLRQKGRESAKLALIDLWRTQHHLPELQEAILSADTYSVDPNDNHLTFVSRKPLKTNSTTEDVVAALR